jgi:anti-anti-sigma regulatory factor
MFEERPFEERALEEGGVLLLVGGKLRGWRARSLGERLCELAEARADGGTERAVLDLTELRSMDSLGRTALTEALDRGLRLDVVIKNRHRFEELDLEHHMLKFYSSLESAIRGRGARSGRAVVAV